MAIDEKPAAAWIENDLRQLCEERRRETPVLEFKSELKLDTSSEKAEVERDVAGMANAGHGPGHIVYGIEEEETRDGSKVASALKPLRDGSLHERLNAVLDGRGEPKTPFDLHAIDANVDGTYLVVEVFGRRRPHRSSNGRYYIRRNLLVREMTEAEIADAYRERFEREARLFQLGPQAEGRGGRERGLSPERAATIHHGLNPVEFELYKQETGSARRPGWLSVLTYPDPLQPRLLDPVRFDTHQFSELRTEDRWRLEEEPHQHFMFRKALDGFHAQLPDREDTFPMYLISLWEDGALEYGDLLEPMFRSEREEENRVVPISATAEYIHDFIMLGKEVYELTGYRGTVVARARFHDVEGYRLAVRPGLDLRGLRPVVDDLVVSEPWIGEVANMATGATYVARDALDRLSISAGVVEGAAYLFQNGNYRRR